MSCYRIYGLCQIEEEPSQPRCPDVLRLLRRYEALLLDAARQHPAWVMLFDWLDDDRELQAEEVGRALLDGEARQAFEWWIADGAVHLGIDVCGYEREWSWNRISDVLDANPDHVEQAP